MRRLSALLASLALLAPAAARTQELGRLFFTPEQRAEMDARRKARVPDKPAAEPTVESPVTRVDGVVRRSGGNSTVWINGEPVRENREVAPAPDAPDRVSISGGGAGPRELRAGQTLDRGSGTVRDLIGEGEIRVGPRKGERRQ